MPRNRTARFAVLGSSAQRAAASGYSSTRSSALKRKIVVGCLVLLSLVLITLSFRSSALDPVQSVGSSVLRPFEIAANRVARPFRDAAGWTSGLVHAKSENEKLKRENAELQLDLTRAQAALAENAWLKKELAYRDSPSFPKDYRDVAATVLTNPTTFDQSVTISAGSNQGVARRGRRGDGWRARRAGDEGLPRRRPRDADQRPEQRCARSRRRATWRRSACSSTAARPTRSS